MNLLKNDTNLMHCGYINSYYNQGYAEGLAQTLNSISVKYTYHTHIDKDGNIYPDGYVIYGTDAPGGCFSITSHKHMGFRV